MTSPADSEIAQRSWYARWREERDSMQLLIGRNGMDLKEATEIVRSGGTFNLCDECGEVFEEGEEHITTRSGAAYCDINCLNEAIEP